MSKLTGKKIKRIRVCKQKVVLYFYDSSKLEISHDTYSSFYLFPNKVLDEIEFKEIKEIDSTSSLLNAALKYLRRSVMSEKKLKDKLLLINKNVKKVDSVIKTLKEHDLINDKAYIEDFLIYANEKKMGQYKIVNELIKRGIKESDAKKVAFKHSSELNKASELLLTLERKYANRSYEEKKRLIYSYLVSHGFSSDISSTVIEKVKNNPENDSELLLTQFNKVYSRLSKINDGHKLNEKVVNTLRRKGFKYSEIIKLIKERNNEIN